MSASFTKRHKAARKEHRERSQPMKVRACGVVWSAGPVRRAANMRAWLAGGRGLGVDEIQRAGLGLLEKGKDWKLRRDDFHFKEKRLKALSEKARNRNPDEFYFAMTNAKTKKGVHVAKRAESKIYTADEMKLMSTQDLGYMNMRLGQERHVRVRDRDIVCLGGIGYRGC